MSAQPQATSAGSKSSGMAFVSHFLPGLVLGLLVGAVATALVQPLLDRESNKIPVIKERPDGQKASDGPRDAVPAMPVDAPAATGEKPAEVKPEVKPEAKPAGTP
jgi:hypothetical protein